MVHLLASKTNPDDETHRFYSWNTRDKKIDNNSGAFEVPGHFITRKEAKDILYSDNTIHQFGGLKNILKEFPELKNE
jgi:hypothetical protein